MADADTDRELNRLYWETDASISEIADRLDVSRRALYDGIEPQPAGQSCPECGAPLGFRNRTALERGEAECPECGFETELDAGEATPETAGRPGSPEAGSAADANGDGSADTDEDRPREPLGGPRPIPVSGASALSSAFVVGVAVGALITYVARRS